MRSKVLDLYLRLDPVQQAVYLTALAHRLTVHIRIALSGAPSEHDIATAWRLNEALHRVVGQASKILEHDTERFSDADLINMLWEDLKSIDATKVMFPDEGKGDGKWG